jgi:hypothetical protein
MKDRPVLECLKDQKKPPPPQVSLTEGAGSDESAAQAAKSAARKWKALESGKKVEEKPPEGPRAFRCSQ